MFMYIYTCICANCLWAYMGILYNHWGFPGGTCGKEPACQCKRCRLILGSGRSPRIENGNPLQCSWLGNSIDRAAWWATVQKGCEELDMTEQKAHANVHTNTNNILFTSLTEFQDLYAFSCMFIWVCTHVMMCIKQKLTFVAFLHCWTQTQLQFNLRIIQAQIQ